MDKEMARESWFIRMEGYTKVSGWRTLDMGKAMRFILMETLMKVRISRGKPMVKESIDGWMMKRMKENGIKVWSMAMAYGEELAETLTLESGGILRLKAMESIFGSQVIGTRETGRVVSSTGRDLTFFQTGMCILATIKMESSMAMVNTYGLMVQSLMGISNTDRRRGEENGEDSKTM
jgi:hypothetical protein